MARFENFEKCVGTPPIEIVEIRRREEAKRGEIRKIEEDKRKKIRELSEQEFAESD